MAYSSRFFPCCFTRIFNRVCLIVGLVSLLQLPHEVAFGETPPRPPQPRLKKSQRGGKVGNLWNLEEMAECKLGYGATVYNNYGCWCGMGGAGVPVDGIDECCRNHDKCYDYGVDVHDCPFGVPEEYVDWYEWSCDKSAAGKNGTLGEPTCPESGQSKCQEILCWCDKTVVDCWANYPEPAQKATCPHPKQKGEGKDLAKTTKSAGDEVAARAKMTEKYGSSGVVPEVLILRPTLSRPLWAFVEPIFTEWYKVPLRTVKWLFGG